MCTDPEVPAETIKILISKEATTLLTFAIALPGSGTRKARSRGGQSLV